MHRFGRIVGVALCLALAGCTKPPPPPQELLSQGMADVLIDTGFYAEVAIGRIPGRHYVPGQDSWTIITCYDFTLPEGGQGNNCVDTFVARRLDNGNWMVAVTINDVYRWRAISLRPGTGPARPSNEPAER